MKIAERTAPSSAVAMVRSEAAAQTTNPSERVSSSRTAELEHPEASRCSVDPMRSTDRYRLVTPYLNSSREL